MENGQFISIHSINTKAILPDVPSRPVHHEGSAGDRTSSSQYSPGVAVRTPVATHRTGVLDAPVLVHRDAQKPVKTPPLSSEKSKS